MGGTYCTGPAPVPSAAVEDRGAPGDLFAVGVPGDDADRAVRTEVVVGCDVLGLPLRHEDEYAVVVDAGGTPLRLAVVPEVPEPAGTNAGWLVDDVTASVRALATVGVTFERFPGMDQDPDGVWRSSPGSGGVAWFRNPDGNRLSLSHGS